MTRRRAAGIPAAAVLAGGISRHGQHCDCKTCVRFWTLVKATRDHGEMCPCDACKEIRS